MNTEALGETGDKWSAKELLIVMPVLGSALAITFDVGYFSALEINYFSLFSISEHITFALEALPFALALSTVAIVAPIAFQYGRDRKKSAEEKARREGTTTPFYKVELFGSK